MIKFYFTSKIQGRSKDGLIKSRPGPCFEVLGDNLTDLLCPVLDLIVKDLNGRGALSYTVKAKDKYGTKHIVSYGTVNIEINNPDTQQLLQEKGEELK